MPPRVRLWSRRLTVAAIGALVGVLGGADAASAGTVSLVTKTIPRVGEVSTLSFADAAGEPNDISVKVTRSAVQVTDRAVAPVPATGCSSEADLATVTCPVVTDHPSLLLDLRGGGGDDALTLLAPDRPAVIDVVAAFLSGGAGNDTLSATSRESPSVVLRAILNGDDGDDRLVGGSTEDSLAGGAGRDTLLGGGADDQLDGDGQGRTAAQFDSLLLGREYEKPAPAPPADDTLDGGAGVDTVTYADRTQPLRVDLADGAPDGSPGEADRLDGIEDILGGDGPNVLLGDAKPNRFEGSETAHDVMDGRAGDDSLFGASIDDTLRGGAGADYLLAPGQGSTCGQGSDTISNPRSIPAVLEPAAFSGCELVRSRSGAITLDSRAVRLHDGKLTLDAAVRFPISRHEPPVRFVIAAGGRTLASRSLRLAGTRRRRVSLTFPLRGTPPRTRTVRISVYEKGTYGRSMYVELPLRR